MFWKHTSALFTNYIVWQDCTSVKENIYNANISGGKKRAKIIKVLLRTTHHRNSSDSVAKIITPFQTLGYLPL